MNRKKKKIIEKPIYNTLSQMSKKNCFQESKLCHLYILTTIPLLKKWSTDETHRDFFF